MSALKTDENQLTLIYSSATSIGKQTLGYVESAKTNIKTIDISKANLGDTVWVSIAEGLGLSLGEILTMEHPDAPDAEKSNFSTDDWLKVLNNNPTSLQKPIAIKGEKYKQISTPTDVLSFFESDSAGIEKK